MDRADDRRHLDGARPADRPQTLTDQQRQLAAAHLPLARKLVATLIQAGEDRDDLISDAHLGLVRAARTFNPDRSVSFITFASHRICGEIADGRRARDLLSRHDRQAIRDHDNGQPVNPTWLARAQLHRHRLSLDEPIDDTEHLTLANVIQDPDADTQRQALQNIRVDEARRAISKLPARDQFVIELRARDYTQHEIGLMLGVTESRVCQIHARALERVREMHAGNLHQQPTPPDAPQPLTPPGGGVDSRGGERRPARSAKFLSPVRVAR